MLILHENLGNEATHVAKIFSKVYKIPVELQQADLSDIFQPISEFKGYKDSAENIYNYITKTAPRRAVMVLTYRDLYSGIESMDDEWIFGYSSGKLQVLSNARMKGVDCRPVSELMVSQEQYLKRFTTMAVHELGHSLIDDKHMKEAYWVNAKTNFVQPLGPHCTDNKCVMYEVVDMLTPPASAGHLLIGKEKMYDAGLDDQIRRTYDDWFCNTCKESISIPSIYKALIKK